MRELLFNRLTIGSALLGGAAFALHHWGFDTASLVAGGASGGYFIGFVWGAWRGYWNAMDMNHACRGDN